MTNHIETTVAYANYLLAQAKEMRKQGDDSGADEIAGIGDSILRVAFDRATYMGQAASMGQILKKLNDDIVKLSDPTTQQTAINNLLTWLHSTKST